MREKQSRVQVVFGGRVFTYRASKPAADRYAHDVGAWLGVDVSVDDDVHDDLPALPCARLWA